MWGIWLRRMRRSRRLFVGDCVPLDIAIEKYCDMILSKLNLHRTPVYVDKNVPS